MTGHLRSDQGAATVWSLALILAILLTGAVCAAVGMQAIARQRLAAVADVSALAAAQATGDPCVVAARVAEANAAELVSCTVDGDDIVVSLGGPVPELVREILRLLGRESTDLSASARAGPP